MVLSELRQASLSRRTTAASRSHHALARLCAPSKAALLLHTAQCSASRPAACATDKDYQQKHNPLFPRNRLGACSGHERHGQRALACQSVAACRGTFAHARSRPCQGRAGWAADQPSQERAVCSLQPASEAAVALQSGACAYNRRAWARRLQPVQPVQCPPRPRSRRDASRGTAAPMHRSFL